MLLRLELKYRAAWLPNQSIQFSSSVAGIMDISAWRMFRARIIFLYMSTEEIAEAVMALPEKERLELARRIVESVEAEHVVSDRIAEAVRGIEDIATGKLAGLSEAEFRDTFR